MWKEYGRHFSTVTCNMTVICLANYGRWPRNNFKRMKMGWRTLLGVKRDLQSQSQDFQLKTLCCDCWYRELQWFADTSLLSYPSFAHEEGSRWKAWALDCWGVTGLLQQVKVFSFIVKKVILDKLGDKNILVQIAYVWQNGTRKESKVCFLKQHVLGRIIICQCIFYL